jgi:alpha-tubulin suppressor-like RCC1 family protein
VARGGWGPPGSSELQQAGACSWCAVTEKGELYTWEHGELGELGHGNAELQDTPKRVEGLNGVKVAAAAIGYTHTLVADEDGVVWAFGDRTALGLDNPNEDENEDSVWNPTPIPTLRVRARKSPDVLPFGLSRELII